MLRRSWQGSAHGLRDGREHPTLMELGSGTGQAICGVLRRTGWPGPVRSFEIDDAAYKVAARTSADLGLADVYRIHNADFFQELPGSRDHMVAISNPPYLPAPDDHIRLASLWGGTSGGQVIRHLISSGFPTLMVMLSSYAEPIPVLGHARAEGYRLVRWLARSIALGEYSREPKVRRRIDDLVAAGDAFVHGGNYLLVGVTWRRSADAPDLPDLPDLSGELAHFLRGYTPG
ncbi:hypothetical protein OK074_5613 [Actinobacteria bacterium OK074]|nr:hypothetical protein OK074_5613 [Actinobacteria bacterium OK074]